ncbi:MAG: histidine kinase [Holophagaceae bacterium]
MTSLSLGRRFLALESQPLGAFGWRLLACALAMQPWRWRFRPQMIRLEDLDPDLVALARSEGVNVLDQSLYVTRLGLAGRLVALALLLALGWWALNRLRRLVLRRKGPGLLGTLVPLVGIPALTSGLGILATEHLRSFQSVFYQGATAVWGGWVSHPLLGSPGFWILLLGIAILGVELVLQAAETRVLLVEAQEGALRSRLAPHFLYNAFNTLNAQIEQDPRAAQETTQRLASLFEQVTRASVRPTVPLREELALVEELLSIERSRLGDRLQVTVNIPEELLEREVPVLALQVLVENALRHAIAPRREGGRLTLSATAVGTGVEVAVLDSGDGVSGAAPGTGQSLGNLRARLRRPGDLTMTQVSEGFRVAFRWSGL